MRKSSHGKQAKPYGDISIARGDEWKARFVDRSVVSFSFVKFVTFKTIGFILYQLLFVI